MGTSPQKLARRSFAALLRNHPDVISVADAVEGLKLTAPMAAKRLARWADQGWLRRVRQGVYVPVPMGASSPEQAPEDAWVLASELFEPCFIAGWSAAEHWGLTEQLFPSVAVITSKLVRSRNPTIGRTRFHLKTLKPEFIFGTRMEWRGQHKIAVADPSRTMLDILDDPRFGGGIRFVQDVLREYLGSEHKDLPLLLTYAKRLGRGTVFKRLGYLLEQAGGSKKVVAECEKQISKGPTQLDPSRPGKRMATRWGLWLPDGFEKQKKHDSQD